MDAYLEEFDARLAEELDLDAAPRSLPGLRHRWRAPLRRAQQVLTKER